MKLNLEKAWFLFLPIAIIFFFPLKSILGEISIVDIFIIINLFIIVISYKYSFKVNKIHFYLFLLIVFSLISFFVNYLSTENVKYWVRLVEYVFVFYITYFYYNEKVHLYFIKGISIVLIILFVYGILQKLFPQLIILGQWGPEWKDNYVLYNKIRVYSFLDNPLNLVGVLSLFLGYFIYIKHNFKFLFILLIYILLLLTGSKIAIGIIGLSLFYLIIKVFIQKKIKKVYLFIFISIIVMILLNYKNVTKTTIYKRYINKEERFESFNQRELVLNSSLKMIRDNPIFGIGAGNFGDIYIKSYKDKHASSEDSSFTSENMFVDFYLDNGLMPFLIFSYIFFDIILSFFFYKKDKVLKALVFAISFFVIVGFVTNLRSVPTFMFFFYFIAVFYKRKKVLNAKL